MNPLFAAVFTVTTKADAGPGSFRDALTKAANNGASEKDSILFNLPGATDADRTIILLSKLPEMTSNLVIDGTSQPGPGFGTGFAKVRLEVANVPQPFDPYNIPYILEASKQENISIFGLVFFYSNWTMFSNGEKCGGVKFSECKSIQIGAAGKGNIFMGVTSAISCFSQSVTANYDPKAGGLIVQGNMVGYTENGDFPYVSGANFNYTEYFLTTSYFGNILVGGDKVEDGNIVNATNISIWGWSTIGTNDIRIANNSFCVSSRRNPGIDSSQNSMTIRIRDQNQGVIIENNIINGFVELKQVRKPFHIRGNIILNGFDSRSLFASRTLIAVEECSEGGLIGGDGPGDPNELTSYYPSTGDIPLSGAGHAIVTQDLYGQNVSIIKNKIHCVNAAGGGIAAFWGNSISLDPLPPSFVRILNQTPTLITGKATPNSRIDLYYDDDCSACEGEIHLGTTTSAADSSWQFSGNFIKTVLATATNSKGATSEFTQPRFANQEVKITNTRCNQNIGSVKGIKLYGNWDDILWYKYEIDAQNATMRMVPLAKTLDIENLGPGIYYFRAKYRNTCVAPVLSFTISNYEYNINDQAATLKQPGCNQANGAISNIFLGSGSGVITDAVKYWEDDKGNRYADEQASMYYASISKLPPGNYRLILRDTIANCNDTTRWFSLTNQAGPSLDLSKVVVKDASCNKFNGSISGVGVINAKSNAIQKWYDSANKVVGTQMDLQNVAFGKYRMAYWDDGGCDTLYTPWFTVQGTGALLINTTGINIIASQCIKPTGNIKGIVTQGSYTYVWKDGAGNAISNTLASGDLWPGTYRLQITSAQGCDSLLGPFVVPVDPFFKYDQPLQFTSRDASCNELNGRIEITNHPALTGYSYRWVSDTLGAGPTLATSFVLGNIGKGKYYFYLKDSKDCEQLGAIKNINGFDKPVVNSANARIVDETCSSLGSISGISVLQTPALPYTINWKDAANNVIGTSLNLSAIPKGLYLLTLTDSLLCTVSASFTVQKATPLLTLPSYPNVSVKRGADAKIVPSNFQTAGTYNLFASNNSTIPSQKNNTGSFEIKQVQRDSTVYVSYENLGCQSEKVAVNIKVYDEVMVTPPNAFSPNGDGINDVWLIRSQGVQQLERLQIFDRYGKIVFETNAPQNGWNGTSNGVVVPAGTYYYLLDYKAESGGKFQQKGSVMVIK